jgi:hypothetical protein
MHKHKHSRFFRLVGMRILISGMVIWKNDREISLATFASDDSRSVVTLFDVGS